MNKENIENDIAQLRAEKSENLARDAGGALAAAPCSAPVLSNQVIGSEYTFTRKVEFSDSGYNEEVSLDANQPSTCPLQ
jgi:hypothetical protein